MIAIMGKFEHLEELCNERGISFYELAQRADITPAAIYRWKGGEAAVSLPSLMKVCDALGITINQFWNGIQNDQLSEEQNELLDSFSKLSPSDKKFVLEVIDFIIAKNLEKKN